MKFAFYILRHPLDGFWDMKHEKKASLKTGVFLILLALGAIIFNRQTRGFIFNNNYNVPLDILFQIQILILPILLFCISNWAITTLMDGKGTFYDIFMVVCYSLVPMILFNLASPLISNILSLKDMAYLTIFDITGVVWTLLMIFLGIQVIHEYSIGKMLWTLVLTTASAAIIIFICLLFFSLLQELGSFVYTIYREIALRT
ncbi:MAG: YIP1 family protein [Saccharofermentanales bacterium]